jgi:cell volume regulation protein A
VTGTDLWAGVATPTGIGSVVEQSSFTLHDLSIALLIGAAVIVVAVGAVRLSVRTGLPSLLIYLGIGIVLGEPTFGINYDNPSLTTLLGYAALVLILVEGGLNTRWESIRRSVAPAAALATVGVLVSVAAVAVAARYLLDLSWTAAAIVGAVLASTDAAAVFSVLRRVPLPRPIRGILEAESGFNDAPVVIIVVTLASQAADANAVLGVGSLAVLLGLAVLELVGGALIGLAIGWVGARLMRRTSPGSSALFGLGVISVAVLAYGAASLAHTSGFIACYLAALLLANSELPHRPATAGLSTALGWLAQIALFVLLGLLADLRSFPSQIIPAIVIGVILVFVARPLSVVVSCLPFRIPWRTQVFLSWAGLRGAVPIVLATVPLTYETPEIGWLFDLVFVLVVLFTLLQAPTLPWLAARLGIIDPHHQAEVSVESTPLDEIGAEMLEVTVGQQSRLIGVRIFELRLPTGANAALIVRRGTSFVPTDQTRLRGGDQVLVVAPAKVRRETQARLYAVSEQGRLAGWVTRSR